MGVSAGGYPAFREAIKTLMKQGRVVLGGGNDVMLARPADTLVGNFRGNPRGFGFVVPNSPTDHADLFIPPGATLQAMTGDTVAARIVRRGRRGPEVRIEGEITRIIERGQNRFVGELVREGKQWGMRPDGRVLFAPVLLGDVSATRAKAGDQIVVELTEFPTADHPPRGVIVEVLGRRGDPEIDTLSIIRQYHLPEEFPEKVLEDARRAVREYDVDTELRQREDLRELMVVTIDPDDARDFDDAISVRRIGKNRFELGVHIADVAAFVTEDSPLDTEARQRGNSVYLPRRVIPMLPEVLSNGLCSLQEDQPRLAKSVFIEYDRQGRRMGKRYANSFIQSRKRLTYGQATAILEGKKKNCSPEVATLVEDMDRLARLIQRRRLDAGMVVLDLPDIELIFDDKENCVGVQPEDTSFSHTIIEMFMVEANE
ncbi:MAG: RNB domain-containing ribonuclease, partial [Phycisphaerales bacterium]|nr:RNB domain-containing ribonuclease [Phycisphaerales bacterium]